MPGEKHHPIPMTERIRRSQCAEGAAESAELKKGEKKRWAGSGRCAGDGPRFLRCVVADRVVFREKMGGAGSRNDKKSGVSTCEKVLWRFGVKGPVEPLCSRKTSLTLSCFHKVKRDKKRRCFCVFCGVPGEVPEACVRWREPFFTHTMIVFLRKTCPTVHPIRHVFV